MARKDEYMQGRNEGMLYALNIAKEKGIDELEKEVKLRGYTNLPTQVSKKAMEECILNIKHNVVDTFVILSVATLHDEFGFGKKRAQRFIERFNLKADCLAEDYCTWEDQIDIIKEELGIELDIRKNDRDVRK